MQFEHPVFARAYRWISERAEGRGVSAHRRRLLDGLRGVVCEVGAGNGLNFAHYPPAVSRVVAVEPEPTLRGLGASAARRTPVPVTVVAGEAGALPVADGACDAVVFSLVLCSVPSVPAALAEARRVLRPDGVVAFYEHVRSSVAPVAWLEDVVTPAWSRLAAGCHANRDSVRAVRDGGFALEAVDRFGFSPIVGAPPVAHVLGRARRR